VTPWAIVSPARLAGPRLLRTQSDERLVDLVRAGNDRAFEAIVLRYRRQLLRHCRRLLPASRAEDAVQQTLLRALEAMRADERKLKLGPWLHRIAHNTAIDFVRRMDSHWEELDERMDGVEPVHAAVERRARLRSVLLDIDALPERQRRALVLRELEGRSYAEIADTLGASGAAVRQLLNRARNAMRAAACALLPPALAGRVAGSQAGVRIAELMDPSGTALVAKTAAAVAAGAVALLAVTGPPSGGGGAVPRAEAAPSQPAPAHAAAAQGQPANGRAAVRADDPRARRSAYRQRWEAPGDGWEARRVAAAPDGARAGTARLAADATA
jgi:RNA polymerase sigma factor (sigma-70 family)